MTRVVALRSIFLYSASYINFGTSPMGGTAEIAGVRARLAWDMPTALAAQLPPVGPGSPRGGPRNVWRQKDWLAVWIE